MDRSMASYFDEWMPDIKSRPEVWLAPIIRSGNSDLALELVQDNPGLLNARFSENHTPLMEAAFYEHHDIAEQLMSVGAKLDFISAIALGRTDDVSAMLDKEPSLVRKHSPEGFSALHIAVRYAGADVLVQLVSLGADVNDNRNKPRLTPLFFATREPYCNAELLLARGADINSRAKHGFTVLHRAARDGDAHFVTFLLGRGARVDLQTDAGQSAWALAVRGGHRSVIAILDARLATCRGTAESRDAAVPHS